MSVCLAMRAALVFLLVVAVQAQSIVLDRRPFDIQAYQSTRGIELYASREEYEAAARDQHFRLEKLAYRSADLKVFAYLYSPVRAAGKRPAVIFNRGSFVRDEFAAELLATFHRLGQAGFVVLAPMYRQSGGGEGRDEMGGADLADLMATTSVAQALGTIDTSNLFMYGESRGRMMTYQAIRDGYPVRAAAVYGAFTDLRALLDSSPQSRAAALRIWPDYSSNAEAIQERRSALRWPERLNTPLLIMHGGNDHEVPPSQSLALAKRLEQLGKPYEIVVRAGDNHVLTGWRLERDGQAVDWFRRHMTPTPR
jgi:dipeptidyl aminopeptidase/acylaminoacyl peptidase